MKKEKVESEISIGFLLLILGLFVLVYLYSRGYDINALRDYINSFGDYAALVLLGIIIVTSSIGFVSAIPVALAAFVFDIYLAFIISFLGLIAGAAISFLIARYLGRNYVERTLIEKIKLIKKYDERLEKGGLWTIFFFRMMYLIPYELINIAGGLSRIDFRKFMLGTAFGIIPTIAITIYFVKTTNHYPSIQFFVALVVMALFAVLPLFSRRIRHIVFNLN
jgi:uncharacterized membrane protein YdjX (TVP38/TMEM64 family)